MEFIDSTPSEEDTASPESIVMYFLEASKKYRTQYSLSVAYPGKNRSWDECVQYCSRFFPEEEIERALLKIVNTSDKMYIFYCPDIKKEVICYPREPLSLASLWYYLRVKISGCYSTEDKFKAKLARISGDNKYLA